MDGGTVRHSCLEVRQRNTLELQYQLGYSGGHSKVLRRFRPPQLKRKYAALAWTAGWEGNSPTPMFAKLLQSLDL